MTREGKDAAITDDTAIGAELRALASANIPSIFKKRVRAVMQERLVKR